MSFPVAHVTCDSMNKLVMIVLFAWMGQISVAAETPTPQTGAVAGSITLEQTAGSTGARSQGNFWGIRWQGPTCEMAQANAVQERTWTTTAPATCKAIRDYAAAREKKLAARQTLPRERQITSRTLSGMLSIEGRRYPARLDTFTTCDANMKNCRAPDISQDPAAQIAQELQRMVTRQLGRIQPVEHED